jgi:3-methylcrotonyl-CoA carboxylase alpha subunit
VFDRVLIANRGEIACRVARTCRRLGIRTVGVHSDADADAMHVAACDEAWRIGPAPARESYLDGERILEAARASGAQAVHPGYGFLSENEAFARACADAGVVFIGPPPDAIRAMGSKSAAKRIMEEAGVPLLPGYHGGNQDTETLGEEAARIGYPVLIKAAAGGGGKGMRRVDRAEEFHDALASARREAAAAFGDDEMLLEKCLLAPRHVEVQVFADTHGGAVHLFERDCSIQRRHQKVVEEAPAPGLDPATRAAMGDRAVAAARAIGYVGAGTVEFIMDASGEFFFMEMNTRLQVEHPVTEMVTGEDLVAWQLAVAAGEPLPRAQDELALCGHAIEVRIYAEDPERDFLPSTGTVRHLRMPPETESVRLDAGIRQHDAVPVHYDPMLAKLIVHGPDRPAAVRRLREALAGCALTGPASNLRFLERIAHHPAFAAGDVSTDFIERHREDLLPSHSGPPPRRVLAVAAMHELLAIEQAAAARARESADPWSPWHQTSGWRMNSDNFHTLHFLDGDADLQVVAHYREGGFVLDLPDGPAEASGTLAADGSLRVRLDGAVFDALVLRDGDRLHVRAAEAVRELRVHDPLTAGMAETVRDDSLAAPMPGTVTAVLVSPGQAVAEGDALVVLEAMKMEYTIRAPAAATVEAVHFAAGDPVSEGVELLSLAQADTAEDAP